MTEAVPQWKLEKYQMVDRWRIENKGCEKGAVVFAGSSLMEMFPVEAYAREQGPDFPTVYNRGVGGWRTEDMLPMLDVLVTDLMHRRLFINIGTNDLSDADVTIDVLISRYDQILTHIEACVPGIAIILMAYYPVNDTVADEVSKATLRIRTNDRLLAANEAVKALAERHHQRFADFNAPLTDAAGNLRAEYTIEGIHIREEGYRAIWPEVRAAILQA